MKNKGYSLHIEKAMGYATFMSITSDRKSDNVANIDVSFDSSPTLAESPKVIDLENFSQEFRITSNGDERLDWQVGALYTKEDLYHEFRLTFGPTFRNYADILAGGDGSGAVMDFVDASLAPLGYVGPSFCAGRGTLKIVTQENKSLSIFDGTFS